MVAQRGEGVTAKAVAKEAKRRAREPKRLPSAPKARLSFKDKHALETLPARIAALEAEIAKLSKTIADPDLYAQDRAGLRQGLRGARPTGAGRSRARPRTNGCGWRNCSEQVEARMSRPRPSSWPRAARREASASIDRRAMPSCAHRVSQTLSAPIDSAPSVGYGIRGFRHGASDARHMIGEHRRKTYKEIFISFLPPSSGPLL